MKPDFMKIIAADEASRRDVFLAAANRLGTPLQNVEKDFWVCWTLDALFNGLPKSPRFLFKGGTSLSKGYGIIPRFSEDIDITIFREDLGQEASLEELEAASGKQRKARLNAIKDACQEYIEGTLQGELSSVLSHTLRNAHMTVERGRVELDEADETRQSLLLWYPSVVSPENETYVRSAVKIESGAKSAIDPHEKITITPYISADLPDFNLSVPGITTVLPERTFWDKVIILHGQRAWFEKRGQLQYEGQRVSRHYYDVYKLLHSESGQGAMKNIDLGRDCMRHASMFFSRPDYDLKHAVPGKLKIVPPREMQPALREDYQRMSSMIFGDTPDYEQIMAAISAMEEHLNTK